MPTDQKVKLPNLAFAISENKYLGFVIDLYRLVVQGEGVSHVKAKKEDTDMLLGIEQTLGKIVFDMRPEGIVSRYSRLKVIPSVFFKSVDANHFAKVIKPAVEKQLIKAIRLCKEQHIPLYLVDRLDNLSSTPLVMPNDKADVVFSFTLENNVLHYRLKVSLPDANYPIDARKVSIITLAPCYIRAYNKLIELAEGDGKKLLPFQKQDSIQIQERQLDMYLRTFVHKALTHYKTEIFGIAIERLTPETKAVLSFEVDWQQQPIAILKFMYGDYAFASDEKLKRKVVLQKDPAYSFTITERNFLTEQMIVEYLLKLGFRHKSGSAFQLIGFEKELPGFVLEINRLFEPLTKAGFEIEGKLPQNFHLSGFGINKVIKKENDWFDVYMEVAIGAFKVPFTAFHQHILDENNQFQLPDSSVFIIPPEWFTRFANLVALSKKHGKGYTVSPLHVALLNQSFTDSSPNDFPILKDIAGDMLTNRAESNSPVWHILREYQQTGVKWLLALMANNAGGILSDDMGLGKTVQLIALLAHIKHNHLYKNVQMQAAAPTGQLTMFTEPVLPTTAIEAKTTLIVMPLSLLSNWEAEFKRFAPHLSCYLLTGAHRNPEPWHLMQYDVVLTTYKTLSIEVEALQKTHFQYIICDESQHIKNPDTLAYKAIKTLNAVNRACLTGTPIENSLNDLWAQMNLLNPGLLGSQSMFRQRFAIPIDRDKNENQADMLKKLIRPFILRRTKAMVAPELPELTVQDIYCSMTEEQHLLYETRKSEIRNFLTDRLLGLEEAKNRFVVLSSLMKLRLLACHPALTQHEWDGGSGKFEQVCEMLNQIVSEGHKVLVFSQFVKHLNLVAQHLQNQSIAFVCLTGQLSQTQRDKSISDFAKTDGSQVFLITLKAGGTGLNLTQAGYVFILDPWWNPAAEMQAINRAHRIGQQNKVIAYRFITANSIEEKIQKLQTKKQDLADVFVNSVSDKAFSKAELLELLQTDT